MLRGQKMSTPWTPLEMQEESIKILVSEISALKVVEGGMAEYITCIINIDHSIKSFNRLLKSGQFSDIPVTCGTSLWHAHRAVVCPRSKFFEAAYKKGFKVSCLISLLAKDMTYPNIGREHRGDRAEGGEPVVSGKDDELHLPS